MSGSKVNTYSIGDANIQALMLSTDKLFKGFHKVSLTNYDSTSESQIAAGSVIECAGALYKFDSNESMTGSPSDGTVYIRIVPGTTTCTAEYTNTAPTWSDAYQGWYGTGGAATYRYLEFMVYKNSTSWGKCGIDENFEPLILFYGKALGTQNNPGTDAILFNNVIIDHSESYDTGTGYYSPVDYYGLYYITAYTKWDGTNTTAAIVLITEIGETNLSTGGEIGASKYSKISHSIGCINSASETRVRHTGTTTNMGYILSDSFLMIKRIESSL